MIRFRFTQDKYFRHSQLIVLTANGRDGSWGAMRGEVMSGW